MRNVMTVGTFAAGIPINQAIVSCDHYVGGVYDPQAIKLLQTGAGVIILAGDLITQPAAAAAPPMYPCQAAPVCNTHYMCGVTVIAAAAAATHHYWFWPPRHPPSVRRASSARHCVARSMVGTVRPR